MSESDIYVEALRQLCAAHGGPEVVAERAGLSSENLKQILKGVLLPSGNPRTTLGVGRNTGRTNSGSLLSRQENVTS